MPLRDGGGVDKPSGRWGIQGRERRQRCHRQRGFSGLPRKACGDTISKRIENYAMEKKLFSDAIILAIMPALGYVNAYLYKMGYFEYYSLNSSLINITTENVVFTTLLVLGLFFGFFYFLFIVGSELIEEIPPKMLLIFAPILISLPIPIFFIITKNLTLAVSSAAALACLASADFLRATHKAVKERKNFSEAFNDYIEKEFNTINPFLNSISKTISNKYQSFIYFLAVLLMFSYALGNVHAQNQKEYLMTNINGKNYILIDKYYNNIILSEIDQENKILTNKFRLMEVGDLKGTISTFNFNLKKAKD
jgi:hypothetical protein